MVGIEIHIGTTVGWKELIGQVEKQELECMGWVGCVVLGGMGDKGFTLQEPMRWVECPFLDIIRILFICALFFCLTISGSKLPLHYPDQNY
jgi:hypothetical protein